MLKIGQKVKIKPKEYFENNCIKFYQMGDFVGYCEKNSIYFLPLHYIDDEMHEVEEVKKLRGERYYKIDYFTWVLEDWVEKI